ncbi:MAG: GmrSD restriction endonuclease domain-containing protein [Acidimicrobiia bacterium]
MADLVDVKLIDGTARTVRELFTGRKYGLDYYQREYTWTESNVTELIDDLATSFLEDYDELDERTKIASYRPYFLGPIVTSSVAGTRYLVDGQQRLTTLTLLLMHLNHLARGIAGAENLAPLVFSQQFGLLTFNINVDEREKVMQAILDASPFDPNGESESVRNIWDRYQNIVELYPDDLKGEALVYFSDWLLERVVLVEIGTTDQDMALEIFETMNDRGLRLSNTDMLKGFLLARIDDPEQIAKANQLWRRRTIELTDIDKNADSEFMKHWLRGKFAENIRERKKDAVPRDFDLIGTAFHKWVRDNRQKVDLVKASDYATFVNRDFNRMGRRYLQLLEASRTVTAGWEHVFYNATTGFTLQYLPIMAAVTPDDDDETFRRKSRLVAGFLDIFVARRMINFRNFGYSTVVYTMFNLAKDVRNRDLDELRDVLADRVADLDESFDGAMTFRLTQRNRSHILYLLARMTAWIEEECRVGIGFGTYVDRSLKKPFEVEHIWANKYERHLDEFDNPHDFSDHRDRFGDLLLLPKDFNASYGALTYLEKLPHYFGQNLLAAPLSPLAYEKNPSFLKFIEETGLPFRPYPEGFTKGDIEERQDLYRQVCEQVWSPEALGLGGGTPSEDTTQQTRQAFYGVSLADLITAGLLSPGEELVGSRSGHEYRATILSDGRIRIDGGVEFDTLSGAADTLTGKSNNGWEFWRVEGLTGPRELARIREEHLAQRKSNRVDSTPSSDS